MKRGENRSRSKKAASEVLGSLLVVAVITTTAALLYTISYPVIGQGEESVKARKAYFDLMSLRETLERVRFMVETNSTYNLYLSGSTVYFRNEPVVYVDGTPYQVSSIVISGKGWTLYYENGAIIERTTSYVKMLSFPGIYYTGNTLTMPLIVFVGGEKIGGGTGKVTLNFGISRVFRVMGTDIRIESSNAEVWCSFFQELGVSPTCTPGNVTFTVPNASIAVYEISVK